MKIVKILSVTALLLFAVIFLAVVIAGVLIPAEQSFTNTVEINASADKVWNVLTDKERFPEWQTKLSKVEVTDDQNWVEYPKDAPEPLRFSVAKDERPNSMSFNYKMGDSFVGGWSGRVTPKAAGVQLETVDSYEAKGWVTKILMYIFFDFDKFAEDWNSKLKQRVETLN